jgi:hypothetical protein
MQFAAIAAQIGTWQSHCSRIARDPDEGGMLMNTFGTFAATVLLALLAITPVFAQTPGASTDPHHPAPPSGSAPAPGPGMHGAGMRGGGMHGGGMPMMEMCRQMMGEMSGMPMMGGMASADPKERAAMMEMRGEMMKSMGDIMMKHARRMQGTSK